MLVLCYKYYRLRPRLATTIIYNNTLGLNHGSLWELTDNPGWYFWVWQAKILSDLEN